MDETVKATTIMSPEQIKERCQYLLERRQGDEPVWTSAQMFPIVSDYLALLNEMAMLRTGVR